MSLGDFFGGLPIIGDVFDSSYDDALEQYLKNQKLYEGLKPDSFFHDLYTPEEYGVVGDYTPQDASYQTISEDPGLKSGQMSYLSKLAGFADSGLTPEDMAAFEEAKQQGSSLARRSRGALMADATSRGVLGGNALGMMEIANQEGAERARRGAMDQASMAAKNRVLYNRAYGDALNSMQGQNLDVQRSNADIINEFNAKNTANQNAASLYNLKMRQGAADSNVENRNKARQYNLENRYDDRQNNWENSMRWAGGMSGANSGVAGQYGARGDRRMAQREAEKNRIAKFMQFGMGGGG